MKENKELKFSFLIIAMISLSLIIAMISTTFNFIINSKGVMTSYMHEDKKLIEDDFYKSKAFDEALIRPLLYWTSTSVIDENDNRNYEFKEHYEKTKDSAKQQLSYINNIKYIAINKDSNEVYSNTEYKTIEDFKKNIKGECDVELSSNNDVISYTKQIKDNTFKKLNANKELRDVLNYNLYDFDVCISINKNFENYGYYDKVLAIKNNFDVEVIYFKTIIISSIISLILFIVSILIYDELSY